MQIKRTEAGDNSTMASEVRDDGVVVTRLPDGQSVPSIKLRMWSIRALDPPAPCHGGRRADD